MQGNIIFIYGRPCSGKTTLGKALQVEYPEAMLLDGDAIRSGISKDLDHTPAGRQENIRRVCEIAKLFSGKGITVIMCFVAPSPEIRAQIGSILKDNVVTRICVNTDIRKCIERDTKGMYAKAIKGELDNFPGYGCTFVPDDSDHMIAGKTVEESVRLVKRFILMDR